eukprot:TRINITY_DN16650_c0_g1_i1.p1 TRINITY_DN16650_c0_g1~~TRINITY_DN16650_c0_g1_i1.p1  ORF type:complete len:201 (+),score=30.90 TRINITY_DN16650_c0_g1_i1:26-604(+)
MALSSSACVPVMDALSPAEEAALGELKALLKLNFANIEQLSRGPAEIMPHLLLGSCDDARDLQALKALGVTHVLNCAAASVRTGASFYSPLNIAYAEFVAQDEQGYNIMQHYDLLKNLADAAAANSGRLFIHCEAGVNRSGTLCLAYHLAHSGMSLLDSAKHCKARRGRICTNVAFQMQLFDFARRHKLPLS